MTTDHQAARPLGRRPCARFTLGQNRSGRWILRDAEGLGYAIFPSYDAAMIYALEETGGVREAIRPCPAGFDPGTGRRAG